MPKVRESCNWPGIGHYLLINQEIGRRCLEFAWNQIRNKRWYFIISKKCFGWLHKLKNHGNLFPKYAPRITTLITEFCNCPSYDWFYRNARVQWMNIFDPKDPRLNVGSHSSADPVQNNILLVGARIYSSQETSTIFGFISVSNWMRGHFLQISLPNVGLM